MHAIPFRLNRLKCMTAILGIAMNSFGAAQASADPTHPFLLFTTDDIPEIKAGIQKGVRKAAWDKLATSASVGKDAGIYTGAVQTAEMAFRYAITGDTQYGDRAKANFFAWLNAVDPNNHPWVDWKSSHHTATLPGCLAVSYDLLYNHMTLDERQKAIGKLGPWFNKVSSTAAVWRNYEAPMRGSGALLSLALNYGPQRSDLESKVKAFHATISASGLNDVFNPDGSNDEAVGYGQYGYQCLLHAGEAFANAGFADPFKNAGALKVGSYLTRAWYSQLDRFDAYTDNHKLEAYSFYADALLPIRRSNDKLGLWGWHQVHGPSGLEGLGSIGTLALSKYIPIVLWYPGDIPVPSNPVAEGIATSDFLRSTSDAQGRTSTEPGPGGLYFLKSGFGSEEKVAISFHVTDEQPNHSHADATHVTFCAYGVEFGRDTPYGVSSSAHHNVLEVNGKTGASGNAVIWAGGSWGSQVGHRVFGTFADVAHGDFRKLYGLNLPRFDRMVMLLKSATPYVLMLDDVSGGSASVNTVWKFNSEHGISGSGLPEAPAVIAAGAKSLEISFLEPAGLKLEIDRSLAWPKTWAGVPEGTRNRLRVSTSGNDVRYLAVMVPRVSSTAPKPRITGLVAQGGSAAILDWAGYIDTVLCASTGTVTAGGFSSGFRLALIRGQGGTFSLVAGGGTRLSRGGTVLVQLDKPGSVSVSPSQVDLGGDALASAKVFAPGAARVTLNGKNAAFSRSGDFVIYNGGGTAAFFAGAPKPTQEWSGSAATLKVDRSEDGGLRLIFHRSSRLARFPVVDVLGRAFVPAPVGF